MSDNIVRSMIKSRLDEFVQQSSVVRNRHMNDWTGEDPAPEVLKEEVGDFLGNVPPFPSDRAGAAVDHLTVAAHTYFYGAKPAEDNGRPRELREAIVVDFCNWVASRFCRIDLAFYTADLPQPRT